MEGAVGGSPWPRGVSRGPCRLRLRRSAPVLCIARLCLLRVTRSKRPPQTYCRRGAPSARMTFMKSTCVRASFINRLVRGQASGCGRPGLGPMASALGRHRTPRSTSSCLYIRFSLYLPFYCFVLRVRINMDAQLPSELHKHIFAFRHLAAMIKTQILDPATGSVGSQRNLNNERAFVTT